MDFGTLRPAAIAMAALTFLVACTGTTVPPTPVGAQQMSVRSFFDIRHLCSLGISPPIELDNAPQAARYRIRFTNTSVLYAPPVDFEVAANGPAIAEDALPGYRGACPGEMQSFLFRLEVLALDAQNRAVGFGYTMMSAESTTRLMRLSIDRRPRMPQPKQP
jgi:hypothetical protein